MKLTGHKTESVYRRYAIVSERDLAEGTAKLAKLRERTAGQVVEYARSGVHKDCTGGRAWSPRAAYVIVFIASPSSRQA
jgi:hypothetical protein